MCIAIYKPEDKKLSKEILKSCWDNNPDGAGFMYCHAGTLRIKKGFMTFKKFFSSFNTLQHKKAVLHFRIKTHGERNAANTHPFPISSTMGFIHNGIISKIETSSNKDMSDTWHFNEHILKGLFELNPKFLEFSSAQTLIQDYIGYSKLVFMNDKEEVWIMNEDKGEYSDGVWYSNSSYKQKVVPSYPSVMGGQRKYAKQEYLPKQMELKNTQYSNVKNLSVNSIVTIRNNYLKVKQDSQGIVETFYQDHTCGVLFFENNTSSGTYERVPIYMLDIADEEEYYYSRYGSMI